MIELTNRPTGKLLLDLLLGALRVHDEQLNALAIELVGRCGEDAIPRLVQEATDRKNHFWKSRNTSNTGMVIILAKAITSPQ